MKKYTLLLSFIIAIVSLQAQDYLISFAGTGANTTVGSVTVENLTQGTSISLSGSEVLHLSGTWNGINTISDSENALRIYPNPTTDISTIDFIASASGTTNIELFDIAGRRIIAAQNLLSIGTHSYQVSGLRSGIYTIRISSSAYTYTGILLSNGAPSSDVRINYLGNVAIPASKEKLKSATTEKLMQYSTGDLLKFTSISGNYKTISTEVPTQSKTITVPFVDCTDGDGNHYSVVQIGTQIWMGENLKTTKYNDGTSIPNVTDKLAWSNLTTPAYCWYNNDVANESTYGALYNWYTVNTNKLAPLGWHIATDTEWTTLTDYLGGYNVAGGKLKEAGNTHWLSPNTGATNVSDFTALPGGFRDAGIFYRKDSIGEFWSSTMLNMDAGSGRYTYYKDVTFGMTNETGTEGVSVRCIKGVYNELPTIGTIQVTSLSSSTAISGGNIYNDGGSPVTARGICYSTSMLPTLANSFTNDGSGIGVYSSNLTGLIDKTRYYVRAYATNSLGTSYGNQVSYIFSPYAGTYHTVGYRIRAGNPTEPVDANQVFSTLDYNKVRKTGFGNYTTYDITIEVTSETVVVGGTTCYKVIATPYDPYLFASVGGMWTVWTGDPAQKPADLTINYYNPVTKTFVLNCFYYSALGNRIMYEVSTMQ